VPQGVIVMRFRVSAVQRHGAGEFAPRRRLLAVGFEDSAEIVVRLGMAGVVFKRLFIGPALRWRAASSRGFTSRSACRNRAGRNRPICG
jgi:hypothetical protein